MGILYRSINKTDAVFLKSVYFKHSLKKHFKTSGGAEGSPAASWSGGAEGGRAACWSAAPKYFRIAPGKTKLLTLPSKLDPKQIFIL